MQWSGKKEGAKETRQVFAQHYIKSLQVLKINLVILQRWKEATFALCSHAQPCVYHRGILEVWRGVQSQLAGQGSVNRGEFLSAKHHRLADHILWFKTTSPRVCLIRYVDSPSLQWAARLQTIFSLRFSWTCLFTSLLHGLIGTWSAIRKLDKREAKQASVFSGAITRKKTQRLSINYTCMTVDQTALLCEHHHAFQA